MTFPVSRYATLTVPVGTSSVLYLCRARSASLVFVFEWFCYKWVGYYWIVEWVDVQVSDKLEILALRARTTYEEEKVI